MAQAEYPESFRCPLSRSLMRDPVTAADGHSYERGNIEEWFAKRAGAAMTSPVTGLRLPSAALVANITLRKSMAEFFAQQKKQRRAWRNGGDRPGARGGGGASGDGGASTAPSGLWNIPEARLELGDLIDKGSFGEVRRGVLVGDDGEKIPVAVKLLLVQTQAEERDMFEKELQVLHRAAMRCQHACRLYGTCVKQGKLALVMKLYAQSLDRLMRKQSQRRFAPADATRYSLEMARAIAELHACAIIIQDLKPANILLDEFENIVVADFGLSAVIEGTRLGTRTVKGTFNYMAPEAFDPIGHGGLTVKADCWSWACCVIELFSGRPPWENDRMAVIMQKVLVGKRTPAIPREIPSQLADVLRRCFSSKASSRPTFMEMLPYLQHVLSIVSTGSPTTAPAAQAEQPRLVMKPANQPVNADAVEQARQPGGPGRPYAAGRNVGQWVEARRRERDARTGRGAAPGGGERRATEERRTRFGADATAASQPPKGEWIQYHDPKTGRPYYYNTATKKTEWRIPKTLDAAAAEPAQLHVQPARDGGATRLGEHRMGLKGDEQSTAAQESVGPRLYPSRRAPAAQAPYQAQAQATRGRPHFTRTDGASDVSRSAAPGPDAARISHEKQVQLLRTAQQRMAAVLATTSSSERSVRIDSTGPGSSTTEESLSASSQPRSANSVSELQAETRKCQSQLRDVQQEMQRLRDTKTEAVRTGKLPGDAPYDSRRRVVSGDTQELLRSEQEALSDVRRSLYSKKRELCRLCRDEEGLGSGAMAKAQEEYDELLLLLHDQREERDLLKVEEQCQWLLDEESVIRYLEHVQQQVTERQDELSNVMALEHETLERQKGTSRRGTGSSNSSGGGSSRGEAGHPSVESVEGAYADPRLQQGAPPPSVEMLVPRPRTRSPMQAAGGRERDFGIGGRGTAPTDAGGRDARDRSGADAGVLARARAMVEERKAYAAGRS